MAFKKIKKFFRTPLLFKLLLFEGILLSLWLEFCIRMGIHSTTNVLTLNKEEALQSVDDDKVVLNHVRNVARLLKKFAPWNPKCHNLAITAMKLLRRRNIESSMHIGFKKDKNNQLEGHAWLTHCNKMVIGDIEGGIAKFKEFSVNK